MQISSVAGSIAAYSTQQSKPVEPAQQARPAGYDGPDREGDGDQDDRGSVTATRGQTVNIVA